MVEEVKYIEVTFEVTDDLDSMDIARRLDSLHPVGLDMIWWKEK